MGGGCAGISEGRELSEHVLCPLSGGQGAPALHVTGHVSSTQAAGPFWSVCCPKKDSLSNSEIRMSLRCKRLVGASQDLVA